MKTTFTSFTPGDVIGPNGRRHVVKDKTIDVSRIDINAFISDDPQIPSMTEFMIYAGGDTYSMMFTGGAIPKGPSVATDDEAVQQGTGPTDGNSKDKG